MGVKRAVDMTLDILDKKKGPIYTYGALIHNPQVVELLKGKGITVITREQIPEKGTVVIRAHGVTPELEKELKDSGLTLLNATCPYVVKVQKIIQKYYNDDYCILIIGDKGHAEVESYLGYAKDKGIVLDSLERVKSVPIDKRLCIVAQTTQDISRFNGIVEHVKKRVSDVEVKVHNTICSATSQRQEEAMRLAEEVDLMIVVGGRNSANTIRLVEKCKEVGCKTVLIENGDELSMKEIEGIGHIGVTAGASTPQWVIDDVVNRLEKHC